MTANPARLSSSLFLPSFKSALRSQLRAFPPSQNAPAITGLERLETAARTAGPKPHPAPPALPPATREKLVDLPVLGASDLLAPWTDLYAEPWPSIHDLSALLALANAAEEASHAPPPSPFYEGEKRKGMSQNKRTAFEAAVARYNRGVGDNDKLVAEGPVAGNKISIIAGDGQSYLVSGGITRGMAGKFRGAICIDTQEHFGVKEMRSVRAPPAKKGRTPNTSITQDHQALSELELLKLVSHNLDVQEVVEYNGKIFVFMTWMAGDAQTLATAQLSPSERLNCARSVAYHLASDLETCHGAGYIHHDVKLANVLWNGDGTMAMSDFGLARPISTARASTAQDSAIKSQAPGGTPGLYAPEIVAFDGYGLNSDVWSLGVTFFHFLMADTRCPLDWRGNQRAHFVAAKALNDSFFAWRRSVLGADGHVDPERIQASPEPFGPYFTKALERDGAMTLMMLQHALVEAVERDSSAALKTRMDKQTIYYPIAHAAAQKATRRIAECDIKTRNVVGVLEARLAQTSSFSE